MATAILCTILLLLLCGVCCDAGAAAAANIGSGDDTNRCEWLEKAAGNKRITRFSVLPGGGWDNLRNRDMGLVADMSFKDCALSDDGTYVTPSHVILYPKRESHVSLMSQVMEHYENYSSSTSLSINAGGNGIFHGIGIDGKFSEEFQQVKRTAISSKTQIGRTQQRYNMYTAQLQPDFRFSKSFANRLVDIGNALINKQTSTARYISDLLVRDFGTHVVTSMDAGAILEKLDYFNRNSLSTSVFTSNKLSQCLSVNFAKVFGLNFDTSLSVTTEEVKKYVSSVQKTTVNANGGPPIGAKINLTDWESRLRENLVAIDRMGEPLYSVISEQSLPQIPLPHLKGVIDSVKDAVLRYYKANKVKGCQDPNSPNFEPLANVDGACQPTMTNFSFGGVFQTCQESRPDLGLGLCGQTASPVQKNPITGDFRCPVGYETVKLITAAGGRARRCYERRRRCWLFFSCKDGMDCYESAATLNAFWCAAGKASRLPQDSGMLYGGAYSPRFNNPATDAKACGAHFRPFSIGRDLQLCLSVDMQPDALAARVPLAGFFSCQAGNPLAEPGRQVVTAAGAGATLLLAANLPPAPAPKRCPDGFSQSTVDLIDGCGLMQCGRPDSSLRRSVARRPPFQEADFRYAGPPVTSVEASGRRWVSNGSYWQYAGYSQTAWEQQPSLTSPQQQSAFSVGLLVGLLGVIGLLLGVALVAAYRRRRGRRCLPHRRSSTYRRLDDRAAEALIGGHQEGQGEAARVDVGVVGGGGGAGRYGAIDGVSPAAVAADNEEVDEVVMDVPPAVARR